MKTVKFLKEHGVEALKRDYSIIVKEYPEDGLLVLNYDQINSPKNAEIVMECRGLILDSRFRVVSRSFDRFFNYGEDNEHGNIDISKHFVFEKVDGSLIKLYFYNGEWHFSTRGTAFAESDCNGFGSFRSLILKALPDDVASMEGVQDICSAVLDKNYTYIFEFTSAENRVVTKYDGYTLTFLASRNNKTGEYGPASHASDVKVAFLSEQAKKYSFDSIEHCLEVVKNLPDLKEGYVLYDQNRTPVCKIKSPAYVACHLLRSEGLNPKRIMQLILMNETAEYLAYYPEDEKFFVPYQEALDFLMTGMVASYEKIRNIEGQKEFASRAIDYSWSGVLFSARKNGSSVEEEFTKMREAAKMALLSKAVEMKGGVV